MDTQPNPSTTATVPPQQDGYRVGASSVLAERRLHTLKYGDLFGIPAPPRVMPRGGSSWEDHR